MPAGRCAATVDPDFSAAARCLLLQIRVAGVPRTLSLGGFAQANFPEKSTAELDLLRAGESFSVVWEDAVFHGHDWLLGPVTARLVPQRHKGLTSSLVRSLTQPPSTNFFPAENRNYLVFRFSLPRFRIEFDSQEPIVNSARIDRIPPFGATYALEAPVRYRPRSTMLPNWLLPQATVEKCAVKLVELKNIKTTIVLETRDSSEARFSFELKNETTEDQISISWMLWPYVDRDDCRGAVSLPRQEVRFSRSFPVEVFAVQRWFAVAISSPFQTDAASIERFPVL